MGKEKIISYSSSLRFYWDELYKNQKKLTPEFSEDIIFSLLRCFSLSNDYRNIYE